MGNHSVSTILGGLRYLQHATATYGLYEHENGDQFLLEETIVRPSRAMKVLSMTSTNENITAHLII